MQDINNGNCQFQSNAQCEQIAGRDPLSTTRSQFGTKLILAVLSDNGSLPWVVSRMGMSNSDMYYISAYQTVTPTNSASDAHFNSHYVNITDKSSSSSTAVASTATASGLETALSTASTTSSTHQSASPTTTATSLSGSHDSLPLALGIALGIPLGIIAVAVLVRILQRRPRSIEHSTPSSAVRDKSEHAEESFMSLPVAEIIHEIDGAQGSNQRQELDGRGM
jgi:hypothetical protein